MKGKLIKTENELGRDYTLISESDLPKNYKLSKENCDEIFEVFDDGDIALSKAGNYGETWNKPENLSKEQLDYLQGFCDALQYKKDKLFTIEDIKKVINITKQGTIKEINNGYGQPAEPMLVLDDLSYDEIIQSIQRPTEIDVEIVTLLDCFDGTNKIYLSTDKEVKFVTNTGIPYVDEDGCLVLKKI
jgi:hypothetical protein